MIRVDDKHNSDQQNGSSPSRIKNDSESEQYQCKTSISQKLSRIIKNITVEPMLACFILCSTLEGIGVQNLGLEKACRVNKNYSSEVCDGLMQQNFTTPLPEEIEVQTLVTYINTCRFFIQSSIPAILVLFVGAWSDHTKKRKLCMIVPIFGEICTAISLILSTYYFNQWSMEVLALAESLLSAFSGGWTTMLMAVYSYIADHTIVKERTYRIGIIDIVALASATLGKAVSGIMLKRIGFYGVFTVCLGSFIASLIYIYFRIKDNTIVEQKTTDKSKCRDVIHLQYICDTFMVLIKKRKSKNKLQILLLMLVYIMVTGPIRGGEMLQYLYLRKQFQFDEVDYSIFSFYSIIVQLLGAFVALSVFSKQWQMKDGHLAILACMSKIIACFMYAFAPNTMWLYSAPLIELIGSTAITVMRSMATKFVEPDESGKINSLFGMCEVFFGLIYGPIFAAVYVKTLHYLPGAYFLLTALITAPSIFIFMYIIKLSNRDDRSHKNEDPEKIQCEDELLEPKQKGEEAD